MKKKMEPYPREKEIIRNRSKKMTKAQADRLTALFDSHTMAVQTEEWAYQNDQQEEYKKARREAIRLRLEFVNLLAEMTNG